MKKVPELFGSMVFNEAVMKERLPKDVYKSLKQTVRQGTALDPQVAGGGQRHEGLGHREGRDPLHPLVPADDGHHRRKA